MADAHEIFKLADAFYFSSGTLERSWLGKHREALTGALKVTLQREDWSEQMVIIVLAAFATELYLKCLLVDELGKAPQTHDLLKLYQQIGQARKDQMAVIFDDQISASDLVKRDKKEHPDWDFSIEGMLGDSADAFRIFRYAYEVKRNGGAEIRFRAVPIAKVARELIIQIHPDWSDPGPPPTFQVH